MFARLFGLKPISPKDLHHLMQKQAVSIVDVNTAQRWSEAHVPGARNLDPISFQIDDLPADKSSLLIFYCSNPLCRKAPNAARRAKSLGYDNVCVMSAGISGWLSKGLPTESSSD